MNEMTAIYMISASVFFLGSSCVLLLIDKSKTERQRAAMLVGAATLLAAAMVLGGLTRLAQCGWPGLGD